jgi:membrane-associated phospholipid phosphatase
VRLRDGWLSAVFAVSFLALTLAVARGATERFDTLVARHFRPMNDWGVLQDQYAPWLTRLGPVRMFALLGVTCVAVAIWRRSWRTLLVGAVPAVLSVAAALVVKNALARPNPLGGVSPDGGSYPSGHMLAVVVSLAACLLIVSRRVTWWGCALLLLPSAVMATALIVTASHWASDVVGAALLGASVVLGTSELLHRRRPHQTE